MATDYQAQVTALYQRLTAIDSQMAKLALKSYVNTIQASLTSLLNSLSGQMNTMNGDIQTMKLSMSDILTILRSK
jgi:hypothetical protein